MNQMRKSLALLLLVELTWIAVSNASFVPVLTIAGVSSSRREGLQPSLHVLQSNSNNKKNSDELEQTFGGYTVKQRLREEVESPFRTVRVYFFGASTLSALVAFYFSILAAFKAQVGGFSDAPPLDEALQSVAINIAAVLVCGFITYRDWKVGDANLARIKQGGALAKLVVQRQANMELGTLADFRRNARVLIAAGGKEYIRELCRSLNSDQKSDTNTLPQALADAEIILVPVLLERAAGEGATVVGDTSTLWKETSATDIEKDRNMNVTRAENVVGFPRGAAAWSQVLETEVVTAVGQGFDVLDKGITLILKKNGKILRRATGQPQWAGLLGTMEVLDGSKFGMPGDDEIYG